MNKYNYCFEFYLFFSLFVIQNRLCLIFNSLFDIPASAVSVAPSYITATHRHYTQYIEFGKLTYVNRMQYHFIVMEVSSYLLSLALHP